MSTMTRTSRIVALAVLTMTVAAPAFGQTSPFGEEEKAADVAPKQTAPSRSRVRLQAVGMLSASHVYTTYGYIGIITDGVVHRRVSADKAEQLLKEVVRLVEMNTAMLKRVEESGVPKSDVATLNQTTEIYGLLRTQAEAGIAYAKSQTSENARAFEAARTQAWSKIAKLLGIGKQAGIR